MVVQSTSFESSPFSFPLTSLRSSPRFRARSRVTGHSRARLFFIFCFQIRFSARQGRPLQKKVGDGIRSLTLRVSSRLLTLKTMMPWQKKKKFNLYVYTSAIDMHLHLTKIYLQTSLNLITINLLALRCFRKSNYFHDWKAIFVSQRGK